MSEAKHTPGPWSVSDMNASGNVDEDHLFIEPGIAFIERKVAGQNECDMPDALLIAAAPELLSDLREAAATLRRYEALHRAKGTEDSTAKAEVNAALASRFEATIAKATQ